MAFSKVQAQAYAEAHQEMEALHTGDQEELVLHIPERDPVRHRWFVGSVVTTCVFAVAGWIYFFAGQVSGFAKAVPQTFASDAVQTAVEKTKSFGTESVTGFKETVGAGVPDALTEVKAKMETAVQMGAVLDEMTLQLQAQNEVTLPESETTETYGD